MGNQRRRRRIFKPGDVLGPDNERNESIARMRALRNSPLVELPASIGEERSIHGKRILDPGSMFVTDWINRNTLSLFPFTIGIVAERILPANPLRTYLLLQNKAAVGNLFINFGQNPTAFASVIIVPGGNIIFEGGATGGAFSPQDDIFILGSVAGIDGVAGEGLWTPSAEEI